MTPILHAILDTPHRLYLAFTNPYRVRNIVERAVEAIIGYLVFQHFGIVIAIFAEYLFFEWLAEPLGFSGYYWERGPRDGESPDNDGYWQE